MPKIHIQMRQHKIFCERINPFPKYYMETHWCKLKTETCHELGAEHLWVKDGVWGGGSPPQKQYRVKGTNGKILWDCQKNLETYSSFQKLLGPVEPSCFQKRVKFTEER